jgi:hypothetical protein
MKSSLASPKASNKPPISFSNTAVLCRTDGYSPKPGTKTVPLLILNDFFYHDKVSKIEECAVDGRAIFGTRRALSRASTTLVRNTLQG